MNAPVFDQEAYNAEVRNWGQGTLQVLRGTGARRSGELIRLLKVRYYKRFAETYGMGFQFPRHGIWQEKGARRGHGGAKGSTWYTNGVRRRTRPESMGRMGQGASPARPWLNPAINARMDMLADIMEKHYGKAAINAILIQ